MFGQHRSVLKGGLLLELQICTFKGTLSFGLWVGLDGSNRVLNLLLCILVVISSRSLFLAVVDLFSGEKPAGGPPIQAVLIKVFKSVLRVDESCDGDVSVTSRPLRDSWLVEQPALTVQLLKDKLRTDWRERDVLPAWSRTKEARRLEGLLVLLDVG